MKKRADVIYVIVSAVLAVAAFANWIWVMATYEATSMELLTLASVPNEAMFGAILAFAVFAGVIASVSDGNKDQKTEIGESDKPAIQETDSTGVSSTEEK